MIVRAYSFCTTSAPLFVIALWNCCCYLWTKLLCYQSWANMLLVHRRHAPPPLIFCSSFGRSLMTAECSYRVAEPPAVLCACILLADNVSDIYNVQCGQQIIPPKLISCSNWPLFYQLEPQQQLGARRGGEGREDRIISDDVKTKLRRSFFTMWWWKVNYKPLTLPAVSSWLQLGSSSWNYSWLPRDGWLRRLCSCVTHSAAAPIFFLVLFHHNFKVNCAR